MEILLLTLFLGVLIIYGQIYKRIESIGTPTVQEYPYTAGHTPAQTIEANENIPVFTGYRNYCIFGLDHRTLNEELNGENSDTIIIVSINNDTKDIRMVSLYRDTLVDIGDEIYAKANAAYAYGGPVQAINMLNRNLDLKITDYVSVDFSAVVDLVDAVGGVDVPLSYAEMVHLNNYCIETSEETGKPYTPLVLPVVEPDDIEKTLGTFHLNGVQATSYCRIRYTASLDMGRTERQRRVIQLVTEKLRKMGVSGILNVIDEILPKVTTSLNVTEIFSMVPALIGYTLDKTTGFPINYKFSNFRGDVIVADTLTANVTILHDFLYGEKDYMPSYRVQEISATILNIVGGEESLQDDQPEYSGDGSSIIWTQDNTTDTSSYFSYTDEDSSYGAGSDSNSYFGGGQSEGSSDSYEGDTGYSTWDDSGYSSSGYNSSGYSQDDDEDSYTAPSYEDGGGSSSYDEGNQAWDSQDYDY